MKTILFLWKEVLKEFGLRRFLLTLGGLGALILFLLFFQLLFLGKSQPPNSASQPLSRYRGDVVVQLEAELSDSEINDLYIRIGDWGRVNSIQFYFSEELTSQNLELPSALSSDANFFFITPGESPQELVEELESLGGIETATLLSENLKTSTPPSFRFPAWMRACSLAGAILFALGALALFRQGMKSVGSGWKGEFLILKYAGVEPYKIKIPFIGYGLLSGIICSLICIGLLAALSGLANEANILGRSFPALLDGSFILILTLWSALLGPTIGLLGVLLGLEDINTHLSVEFKEVE
ncbi:MAG: hypothetical protein ACOCZX_04725 [Candidatus Bipolaricaulota bacterium]